MTIWPLKKFFGQTASRETPAGRIYLRSRQEALLSLLNNERDHHHIQVFLNDLEPRDFSQRPVIEALNIFLACPGNRLDVYVPTGTSDRYYRQHHAFMKCLDKTTKAQLHEINVTSSVEFMLGSHGQAYTKMENGVGILTMEGDTIQAKLAVSFASFDRQARVALSSSLQYS